MSQPMHWGVTYRGRRNVLPRRQVFPRLVQTSDESAGKDRLLPTTPRALAAPFEKPLTSPERLADQVAAFGGSWTFILCFLAVLVGWVLLNSEFLLRWNQQFDPYPYILLNLFLSMIAALQAPVIMMSQKRQAAIDRLQSRNDYEVNCLAEIEIAALHNKIDALRMRDMHEALSRIERWSAAEAIARSRLNQRPKRRRQRHSPSAPPRRC